MSETTEKPSSRKKYKQYRPILLVYIYRYAKAGLSDEAIARMLEISRNTIKLWKQKKAEVREALELARKDVPDSAGFSRYFYSQLEPKLQELWDRIMQVEYTGGGAAQLSAILDDQGASARQALFLHALVYSHYSPSRACERVGIDKRQLDMWLQEDPEFGELIAQIPWLKANFFEESLVKLVEQGDRSAILFANKTFNKERGYGLSADINVTHKGSVQMEQVLDLTELELSEACRLEIVTAIRKREEAKTEARIFGQKSFAERAFKQIEAEISEGLES